MATSDGTQGYGSSAQAIRETTKWITAAFAGVGAVVLAAIPIKGVKWAQLSGGRIALVACSLAVALLGVVIVVLFAGRVLAPEYAAVRDLHAERRRLAQRAARKAAPLPGEQDTPAWWTSPVLYAIAEAWPSLARGVAEDVPDLHRQEVANHRELAKLSPQTTNVSERNTLGYYRDRAQEIADVSDRVVAFANAVATQVNFSRFRKAALVALVMVTLGIVGLTLGISTPAKVGPGRKSDHQSLLILQALRARGGNADFLPPCRWASSLRIDRCRSTSG